MIEAGKRMKQPGKERRALIGVPGMGEGGRGGDKERNGDPSQASPLR